MARWAYKLRHRLRSLFGRKSVERELSEEVRFHLEKQVEENRAKGMNAREARHAAMRQFGGVEQVKEECRDTRGVHLVETTLQDIRYGVRQLRRNPGFTIVAILTLALGIGVNTSMFSGVSALLLRKPPVSDPNSLCAVTAKSLTLGAGLLRVSPLDFESWQRQNDVFSAMAAAKTDLSFDLTSNGEPEPVTVDRVTPDYFKAIGVMPALGRPFLPGEAQAGRNHVAILSNGLWHQRFGSNAHVVGQTLELDHVPYTIVGVMPRGSSMPMPWIAPRLWLPLVFGSADLKPSGRGNRDLTLVLGRLKPGVTVGQAQAEMSSIAQRLAAAHPGTNKGWGATVLTLQEYLIEEPRMRTAIVLLMCMVGFVLLIACANIAGLLLARGAARAHEMALRAAIGASRLRLVRQMLVESLLIGIAGGAGGLILSVWGIGLLRVSFSFNSMAREQARLLHLDPRTLLFTLLVSLLASILFGLVPAFRASRADPGDALSEGGRSRTGGRARSRLRNALVVGEVALALVLSAAAGITALEVNRELSQSTGFNTHHLLFAEIDLKGPQYKSPSAQVAFLHEAIRKLRTVPGVDSVGATVQAPFEGSWGTPFRIVGRPSVPASELPKAQNFIVGPDYFHTMQILLIQGRVFSDSDDARRPAVAVINRQFARRFFPGGDAIGQQIEIGWGKMRKVRIAGVVGNVLAYYGQFTPNAQIYECYLQVPNPGISFAVRSGMVPGAIAPAIRRAVWKVDRQLPVQIETVKERAADNQGGDRMMVELMGTFAGLALLLAGVGIYGVIAYSVNRRSREIGVRIALGAQRKQVLALLLRQGGLLAGIGCAIGIALALPLPRVFTSLFGDFPPRGLPSIAIAAAVVFAASLFATYIPARRAMKVDPMAALRHE